MRVASVIGVLLVVGSALDAQAPAKTSRRIGIVGGVNLATFSDADGADNRVGFMGGVSYVQQFRPEFSLRQELLYTMKGAEDNSSGGHATAKIDYVELPVLLQYDVPVTGGVRPVIYAGPAFSLKVSCNLEGSAGDISLSASCDEIERDFGAETNAKFSRGDIGAVIGGGLAFDAGGRQLTIGVRYEAGFVKLISSDNSDSRIKNRVLSFVGSFEFPLGR